MKHLCLALLASVLFAGSALSATIAPEDQLTISIVDWDSTTGRVQPWQSMPTAFSVDTDGEISVPFLGLMPVAGMSPDALGQTIATGLLRQLALATPPSVTVTISQRPPVLVTGLVRDSGPQVYQDGLTARMAMAMAGGVPLSGLSASDPMRTQAQAVADLKGLRQSEDELAMRVARLQAERTGAETIEFPPLLLSGAHGTMLQTQETNLLQLHQEQTKRSLTLIAGRINNLNSEIDSLNKKSEVLEEQRTLAQKQQDAMTQLADRGLAVNSRQFDAQRALSLIETQSLDVQTSILRAKQDLAKAEADRLEAVEGRSADLLGQLQTAQAKLADTQTKRVLQEQLVAMLGAAQDPDAYVHVTLRRRGEAKPIEADLDTVLKPGDILTIGLDPKQVAG
ncbi:hypothetical protein DL1_07315 [Thioclava dalianensis]|uniref:Sugar ABC transporter substrate-binding protein n=1 Tax=Thioclava dalianensis TaxID=1185766 RepID=A0A074TR63_9RHOB|nr:polysaccharide biosynthesis/export family protein [Thioclava dalianensis]KEP71458.1 hypothetical protein DL1_07315 [Thioclava dalianensis]SFM78901.1 polysaccharide export outer membrane protein/exopolysaccharide production protein ExoF [Thioclava dalianensis]